MAYPRPNSWPKAFDVQVGFSQKIDKLSEQPMADLRRLERLDKQWPNAKVKDALDRINQVISTPDWGPDTLVKILPDRDVAFFDDYLRSRVQA